MSHLHFLRSSLVLVRINAYVSVEVSLKNKLKVPAPICLCDKYNCAVIAQLSAYRVRKVPLLRPIHVEARKAFGQCHLEWDDLKWNPLL